MEAQHTAKENSKPDTGTARGEAVKLKPLRDSLHELERAYELKRAAQLAFNEKIKAVAEKSGVAASVIRTFIAARMADDSEKAGRRKEQADQLQMVFDDIGL